VTVLEEMRAMLAGDPQLAHAFRALSPGDRSVIYALLDTDAAQAGTVAGSANARLWTLLEAIGIMRRGDEPDLTNVAPGTEMLSFTLTDRGYRALPVLMALIDSSGQDSVAR
jgi:hypothetical protein